MPLSAKEVQQLTRIETELARHDRRLNRQLRSIGGVNRWLIRLSWLGLALAVLLVTIGVLTEVPEAYIGAWFVLMLALVARCSTHLVTARDLPETLG